MEQKIWSMPRNLFLHLLMIGALYAVVIGLLILLFQYINVAFPDLLSAPYTAILDNIRRAEAVLLVVFPVFLFLSWLLERDFARDSISRESKVRKWLIYFTLFLSAVTIIVDLIILIYDFLGGDLRIQFFLKIAVVLIVAAKVFGYYFWELRRKDAAKSKMPRYAAIGSSVFVIAVVVAGFFVVGSPATQRARRFDTERVSHLRMIQEGIINYWIYKEELPPDMDALKDDLTGFAPERDPETGEQYGYRATGPLSFELCALFKTEESSIDTHAFTSKLVPLLYPDGSVRSSLSEQNEIWRHPAGRHCFSRTIDPEFYAPEKRQK